MVFPINLKLIRLARSSTTAVINVVKTGLSLTELIVPDIVVEGKKEHPSFVFKKCVLDDLVQFKFVKLFLDIAVRNDLLPSQAMTAMNIFAAMPLPTAAVVVTAGAEANLLRLANCGHTNITHARLAPVLRELVENKPEIAKLVSGHLNQCCLYVLQIDRPQPVAASAQQLLDFFQQVRSSLENESPAYYLESQIFQVAGSLHIKCRRQIMRSQGGAYGSFEVTGMTLRPRDAQRNTRQNSSDFASINRRLRVSAC